MVSQFAQTRVGDGLTLCLFMAWNCPICEQPIRHSQLESQPRSGFMYRCHICRLELQFEPYTSKLAVAPTRDDELARKTRNA